MWIYCILKTYIFSFFKKNPLHPNTHTHSRTNARKHVRTLTHTHYIHNIDEIKMSLLTIPSYEQANRDKHIYKYKQLQAPYLNTHSHKTCTQMQLHTHTYTQINEHTHTNSHANMIQLKYY